MFNMFLYKATWLGLIWKWLPLEDSSNNSFKCHLKLQMEKIHSLFLKTYLYQQEKVLIIFTILTSSDLHIIHTNKAIKHEIWFFSIKGRKMSCKLIRTMLNQTWRGKTWNRINETKFEMFLYLCWGRYKIFLVQILWWSTPNTSDAQLLWKTKERGIIPTFSQFICVRK